MRAKLTALLAGGLVVAALAGLWLSLPGLIAARWTGQLQALGFAQASVNIDDLAWGRASGRFSLGDSDGADRFVAHFTPGGLWSGRLDGLEMVGLRLSRPLSIGGLDVPPALLDVPLQVKDAHLVVALPAGIGTFPLSLDASINPTDTGRRGEGHGALTVGTIAVPLTLRADWRGDVLTTAGFTLASPLSGPHLTGRGNVSRLPAGEWTGEVEIDASDLPDGLPDVNVRWKARQGQALLQWRDVARLDALLSPDHSLSAVLRIDDLPAFAARLGQADPGLTGGPFTVTATAHNVALELPPRTWPDLSLRLEARGVGIGQGPRDNALSLAAQARRVDGGWWLSPTAPDQPTGHLTIPTLGLDARGVTVAGRAALPLDLELRTGDLRLPWLAPSTLSARLRGDPAGELRLEWQAHTGAADLRGAAEMSDKGGNIVARLAPLRLAAGDAGRLFPGAPLPAALTGTVAARLGARWTGDGADGTADILLEDVGLRLPSLGLAGVNGVLRFDRLSPLSMPIQTLFIGQLDPGFALTDGVVGLSLSGGALHLAPEPFLWSGERVTIPATTFRLGNDHLDLRVDMTAMPLLAGLRALGIVGLDADGTLTGSIPIRIYASGGRAGPGRLYATGPGRLAVHGDAVPRWLDPTRNDSLALVMRALADYRFTALELALSDRGNRLILDGANPSLYGGYATPMNLALSAPPGIPAYGGVPAAVAAEMAAFKARKD